MTIVLSCLLSDYYYPCRHDHDDHHDHVYTILYTIITQGTLSHTQTQAHPRNMYSLQAH